MRTMPVVLVLILMLFSAVAWAGDKEAARQAFKEGVAHYEAREFEAAAKAFRKADQLSPSWRIQYNIGQCEAALKRYGPAIEAFEAYLSAGGDEIAAERQDEVLTELQRLRLKVGSVEVRGPDGIDLLIDGVKRGTTPLGVGVRISAGIEHELTLARSGKVVLTRKIKVGGGQTMVVEVPSEAEGPAAPTVTVVEGDGQPATGEPGEGATDMPTEEPQPDDGPSWVLITGIAATGAGVAMMAVGGGFYAKGKKDIEKYEEAAAEGDEDRYYNLKDDVLPMDQAMTTTGFVVGGVLLATGIVLLVLEFTGGEEGLDLLNGANGRNSCRGYSWS
jgi:tetratricopeptide (TPR) repeat protein